MVSKRKNTTDTLELKPQVMANPVDDDDDDEGIYVDHLAEVDPAPIEETTIIVIEPVIELGPEPEAPPAEELKEIETSDDTETVDLSATIEDDSIDDPVRMYLREISRVKLLKGADEVALAKLMESSQIAKDRLLLAGGLSQMLTVDLEKGRLPNLVQRHRRTADSDILVELETVDAGRRAHQSLTEANLRLVVSIAKKYMGRGLNLLDLIQEGNIGLTRAVDKFDYKMGFKFSTYATWWVRQAITRAIADQARTIRIPVHMVETINNLYRATRRLVQDLGREPTDDETAEEMNRQMMVDGQPTDKTKYTAEKVREIKKAAQQPVSLETPIGEEEDSHLGDFIEDRGAPAPMDAASRQLLKEQVEEVLASLGKRERTVLQLRFGLENGGRARTLEEVGAELGVTRERIRQIEAKALRKLRHPSRSKKLKDYLE